MKQQHLIVTYVALGALFTGVLAFHEPLGHSGGALAHMPPPRGAAPQ
jgi:hypothetical protein